VKGASETSNNEKYILREYYPFASKMDVTRDLSNRIIFNKDFSYKSDMLIERFIQCNPITAMVSNDDIFTKAQTTRFYMYNGTIYSATCISGFIPLEQLLLNTDSFSFQEILHLFLLISFAIREYHQQGMIHLSLNPKCLFVSEKRDQVLVMDYDGAYSPLPNRNIDLLFPNVDIWVAPEIRTPLYKKKTFGFSADIFSLGAILYRALYGHFIEKKVEIYITNPVEEIFDYFDYNTKFSSSLIISLKNLLKQSIAISQKNRFHSIEYFINGLYEVIYIADSEFENENCTYKYSQFGHIALGYSQCLAEIY